jgi:hypothetical protein
MRNIKSEQDRQSKTYVDKTQTLQVLTIPAEKRNLTEIAPAHQATAKPQTRLSINASPRFASSDLDV